jgi:ATP-dependent Lon protease
MNEISFLNETYEVPERLPLVPLRDVVVFPHMVYPLLVGRPSSIEAVEEARKAAEGETSALIFLAAQSSPDLEQPTPDEVFDVGVVARILQVVPLPSGMLKVVVEGMHRVALTEIGAPDEGSYSAVGVPMPDESSDSPRIEALTRSVVTHFSGYVDVNRQVPEEVVTSLNSIRDPAQVVDVVASHLSSDVQDRQRLLTQVVVEQRLQSALELLAAETEILQLEQSIEGEVRNRMQNNQREYYLQEQLRAIREELGEDDEYAEIDQLKEAIRKAGMPKAVREKAESEVAKLGRMHTLAPESAVVRNYLDWLISLPWKKRTKDRLDLRKVQGILDEDHYGLEKAKERVVEYLAVLKMVGKIKGPILCFVGPPGTGKTSVARSIARALGRKFVRMSLGGMRDEAEIRGHRRTYIGALPGRIIQSIKKAGTRNPVFLLDEIDKLSSDFRGDPASALLELLDPEQNQHFVDHYLEVEYDVSEVLFITTANTLYSIPPALRDRMEVIEMPGYLEPDKMAIARGFLLPKQLKNHGLEQGDILLSDKSLKIMIARYTQEAGVRNLERSLATLCRKVARRTAEAQDEKKKLPPPARISPGRLERYLGVAVFDQSAAEKEDLVGAAQGLVWTSTGGDLLKIEVALVPGRGRLQLTGKLGDVMRESARAALTYARAHALDWGYDPGFYKNTDIHIHVPEGAIPKDGPSAGITMATALISALSRRPVRRDVAMTGEITLRGHVLPIGGLNEKVMAAKRSGVGTVILPVDNARHLKELPRDITRGLEFIQASRMHEVLETALRQPAVRTKTASGSAGSRKGRKQSDPSHTGDGRRKRTPPAPPAPPGLGT